MRHTSIPLMLAWLAGFSGLLSPAPASAQSPPSCGEESLAVTIQGRRALLTIGLDGTQARVVLDTGAQLGTVLLHDALQRLRLTVDAAHAPEQGMSHGRAFPMTFAAVRTVRFAGETANVSDVAVVSGGWSEEGVDGFFNDRRLQQVDLDLARGDVRLTCPGAPPPVWTQGADVSMVRLEPHVRLFGTARVNAVPMRVLFDTGSPDSSMTLAAAARAGVRVSGPPDAGQFGLGMASALKAWTTTLASLTLGAETVPRPVLAVVDKPQASADMLIGFDFFATHRVWIDKAGGRLLFRPNGGGWLRSDPAPRQDHTAPGADGR